jgi:HK97 family phage major capsid protein
MQTKTYGGLPAHARRGQKEGAATPPAATPPATPPPAAPPAPAAGAKGADSGEFTAEQLHQMIGAGIREGLKAALPEHLKGLATEDSVKAAIAAELQKQKDDSKSVTKENLQEFANAVVTKAISSGLDQARRGKKNIFDEGEQPAGRIEVPTSWTKGNLPVHGKQLLNIMLKKPMNDGIETALVTKAMQTGDRVIAKMCETGQMGASYAKSLTSTGANTGDELVPLDLDSELQRRFYMSSDLAAMMAVDEILMPTNPYKWPLAKTRTTFYGNNSENTATTASDPATDGITIEAKKFMGQTNFSDELNEDAIVPVLNWLLTDMAASGAAAWESALINGDTTATHQDSDIHAITNAAEKQIKGFRKLALAVGALSVSFATGGITDANLRALKKALLKWGTKPKDLMLICGPMGQNDLEGLTEVRTVDKFGANASIVTGVLPRWAGIPIITSEAVRENLNASGVYDATTTTKGSILLVNRMEFLTGRRRDFRVRTEEDIETETTKVVASFRKGFVPRETPSVTIRSLAIGYNYNA